MCMIEFTPGEKFVISGPYAVHRRCASGKPQLMRDYEELVDQANRINRELEVSRVSHKLSLDQASQDAAEQQSRISSLTVQLLAKRRDNSDAEERLRQLQHEVDGERSERRSLQLQVEMMRRPSYQATENEQECQNNVTEPEDGTSKRFSLLEFD